MAAPKKLGIREARKAALEMAASLVADGDFNSLFGDEIAGRAAEQDDGDAILAEAQQYAADRIRKLAGSKS
jgi:hypothetical protein